MWLGEGWALRALALLLLGSSAGWGSESPDRDCCEPLYPFIPPPTESTTTTTTTTTTRTTTTPRTQPTTVRRTPPPLTTTTTTTTTVRPYIPPPTRKPPITTVVFIPPGRDNMMPLFLNGVQCYRSKIFHIHTHLFSIGWTHFMTKAIHIALLILRLFGGFFHLTWMFIKIIEK